MYMNTVGIAELRQNLSKYLRRVDKGERLLVTDRNRPVAELGPPPSSGAALDRLIARGGCPAPVAEACPLHSSSRAIRTCSATRSARFAAIADVPLLYLDSSALVKLVREEPESAALRGFLADADLVSSELVLTEVPRAIRRAAGVTLASPPSA